jgi:formiminotetrahydrofolate cyclodeaminase
MLAELTVKGFLAATAGSDPVPGGGSVAALNGAIAASLAEMVANLTIGKKKYEDKEPQMLKIAGEAAELQRGFTKAIDEDSDAYNAVFEAFKLPKESDDDKAARTRAIQAATRVAAESPLQVARRAAGMMEMIAQVAADGNQNAVTDACVAMMCARSAVLGAALNVRINLLSLKDEEYVGRTRVELELLENEAVRREQELLTKVRETL